MSVLASHTAGAARVVAPAGAATGAAAAEVADVEALTADVSGPVVFSVRDPRAGEVSILHGASEVIVRDRQLVARILRASRRVG